MAHKLDLSEKIICRLIGKMFERAASEAHYSEVNFCKAWLQSALCQSIISMDETLICQSRVYLWNTFKKEINLPKHDNYQMDGDVMYWAGYIFTYWMFYRGISAGEIEKNYDIAEILNQYDVLHTLSNKVAVQSIEKDYRIIH